MNGLGRQPGRGQRQGTGRGHPEGRVRAAAGSPQNGVCAEAYGVLEGVVVSLMCAALCEGSVGEKAGWPAAGQEPCQRQLLPLLLVLQGCSWELTPAQREPPRARPAAVQLSRCLS